MNIFLDTNTLEDEPHQHAKIRFFLERLKEDINSKNRWTIILNNKNIADLITDSPKIEFKLLNPGKNRISRLWYKYVKLPRVIRKERPQLFFYTSGKLSAIFPIAGTLVEEFRMPVSGWDFQPLDWEEKNAVKKKFTDGREFFLSEINWKDTEKIKFLLKAFSRFKKRQHSNMKLVLLCYGKRSEKASSLIDTYKFRKELHLFDQPATTLSGMLLPAAYALIVLDKQPGNIFPADAMHTMIPVICVDDLGHKMAAEKSVLYFEKNNEDQLTACMMTIFKDENLRSFLIKSGSETVKKLEGSGLVEFLTKNLRMQKP
ncbi:MAG TPA: glycosyltransferase [Parasegetibacter sp.]